MVQEDAAPVRAWGLLHNRHGSVFEENRESKRFRLECIELESRVKRIRGIIELIALCGNPVFCQCHVRSCKCLLPEIIENRRWNDPGEDFFRVFRPRPLPYGDLLRS